jgi:predicted glycoside hydrolase/deacetylase ChbG (UPF0249 family)
MGLNLHPTRQLIITADDCGLSEGINETALDLYERGLLTTATVMMNFEATEHALGLFQDVPGLRVGVHLNLTDGYPLTAGTADNGLIQSDGRFQPRTVLFPRGVFPANTWLDAVREEMVAQIETYHAMTGRLPDHLTTHMHFHILPSLRGLVIELAEEYGIQWVRAFETTSTVIPFNFLMQEPTELFHPDNLRITPDYIVSIQAWLSQEPARLVQTLRGLNGLIEIVLHPDDPDDATYPADMNHKPSERARERDYLIRMVACMADHEDAFTLGDPAPAAS